MADVHGSMHGHEAEPSGSRGVRANSVVGKISEIRRRVRSFVIWDFILGFKLLLKLKFAMCVGVREEDLLNGVSNWFSISIGSKELEEEIYSEGIEWRYSLSLSPPQGKSLTTFFGSTQGSKYDLELFVLRGGTGIGSR